jgi:hypothetical protein
MFIKTQYLLYTCFVHKQTRDESNEGIKLKKSTQTNSAEPHFYVGLIIKGTEKQYLDLLNYVNNKNGAQVIYQCKSLTYLRVSKDECVNIKLAADPLQVEAQGAQC